MWTFSRIHVWKQLKRLWRKYTAGDPQQDSARASGCVDDISQRQRLNYKKTKGIQISQDKKAVSHAEENTIKDLRRGFVDKGRLENLLLGFSYGKLQRNFEPHCPDILQSSCLKTASDKTGFWQFFKKPDPCQKMYFNNQKHHVLMLI